MDKIKISVIIPVYNVDEYLEECLETVYRQTLKELEVILVDDGSTDYSLKILKEYKIKYPKKTKLIIKENGGQSSARNLGLKSASGEYISFIDSDDFIDYDMFKIMYEKAKKNDLDIVQCLYENYFVENLEKNFPYKFIEYNSEVLSGIDYFELDPAVGPCDKLYKREFLNKLNFCFKEGIFAEDALALPQLFYKAKKVKFINKVLYFYRRERMGSTTNSINVINSIKLVEDKFYVVKELEKFRLEKKWNGNISRIIIANIVTPFLKKEMKQKEYRKKIFKEFKSKKILFIFFKNINFKIIKKLIKLFLVRIREEGKI
ncbi:MULTISPECIES: glycosyltransferase [Psychrilyobacter]|nr:MULTISPECIES: glycosyltransferase [Psychrilyobacter]MCS5420418.1 glycosyltransferase [Psychrilyobacter sp. S5]NDI76428.1 glycosyltransferase [Psychrilyobacter piezotolerans]